LPTTLARQGKTINTRGKEKGSSHRRKEEKGGDARRRRESLNISINTQKPRLISLKKGGRGLLQKIVVYEGIRSKGGKKHRKKRGRCEWGVRREERGFISNLLFTW